MNKHYARAILVLFAAACADMPPTTPSASSVQANATAPSRLGVIVFQSNRAGNTDIWRVDADGTNLTRLTDDPAIDATPDLSRDGNSIVFISNRGTGWFNLWAMDVDGSNLRQLTHLTSFASVPAWSRDGERIVFNLDGNAWVIAADGSGMTPVGSHNNNFLQPDWAPNGDLVFTLGNSPSDLWRLDRRGNLTAVTDTLDPDHSESAVAVSPSGRRVAFARIPWFGISSEFEIWVTDIDGKHPRQITTGPGVDGAPTWSPDGRWLVFHRHDGDFNRGLYVVPADGSEEPRLLLENPQGDAFPSWAR